MHSNRHIFENGKCLVFAPERVVLQALRSLHASEIITTDYHSIDVDFPQEDIQQLSFSPNRFNVIICNHVLEHVPDDQAAIAECARVLEAGGTALFTIPGDYKKHNTWIFKNPDSNGHYRHYGIDVMEKFRDSFDQAEAINMGELGLPAHHIRDGDLLFVCRKISNA